MLSTAGCEHLADNRAKEDGALIKVIKDSGAIIIVRGNVSQVSKFEY
jgi:Asp-tRNA(Asn)/Glu-tRNA(Gln) amidotransferase A subunit family amidase